MRRIPSPWIWGESRRIDGLDAMVAGLKEAAKTWPMTVGWVDCLARGEGLGRGILMMGRWAEAHECRRDRPRSNAASASPASSPTGCWAGGA